MYVCILASSALKNYEMVPSPSSPRTCSLEYGSASPRSSMGLEQGAASLFISGMAALPAFLTAVSPSPGQALITFYWVKAVGLTISRVQGQSPQSAPGFSRVFTAALLRCLETQTSPCIPGCRKNLDWRESGVSFQWMIIWWLWLV